MSTASSRQFISSRLAAAIRADRRTLTELAAAVGTHQPSLSDLLNGGHFRDPIVRDRVERLADLVGVPREHAVVEETKAPTFDSTIKALYVEVERALAALRAIRREAERDVPMFFKSLGGRR